MRQFIHSIKFAANDALGFGGFVLLRGLERVLPVSVLYRLCWGPYLLRAALNELFKHSRPASGRPPWLQPPRPYAQRVRRRAEKYLNRLLEYFPDRLASPQWQARCRVEGFEHLRAARLSGRPVILGFFHFGAFFLLQLWLRGYGIPAAAFVGGHAALKRRLTRLQEANTPFPEVPLSFYTDQLRAVAEFLAAGNVLFMAVDTPAGRQMTVPLEPGWTFDMNTGAARLAGRHGAEIILCSIINEGGWRYRLRFSPPVGGDLRAESDRLRANSCLLREMLCDLKARPQDFDPPPPWNPIKPADARVAS